MDEINQIILLYAVTSDFFFDEKYYSCHNLVFFINNLYMSNFSS